MKIKGLQAMSVSVFVLITLGFLKNLTNKLFLTEI